MKYYLRADTGYCMRGQWLGLYKGNVAGTLMINIDKVDDHFEAVAYLHPSQADTPSSIAYVSTDNTGAEHKTIAYIAPIDPRTGLQSSWENLKELYPGTVYSTKAEVTLRLADDQLFIDAISDVGVALNAVLDKPQEKGESKIQGQEMSWLEFKSHIATISKFNFIFRGQQKPWKLRTSFHRCGRYRMSEFTSKDVKQLHQKLSAITSHFFDLAQPDQNGSFFNLLQHHGYPTPLPPASE
jgi:hypothetical protein